MPQYVHVNIVFSVHLGIYTFTVFQEKDKFKIPLTWFVFVNFLPELIKRLIILPCAAMSF